MKTEDKIILRKGFKWTTVTIVAWLLATQLVVPLLNGSLFVIGVVFAVLLIIGFAIFVKNEIVDCFPKDENNG